ncbi:6-phosphofructokinase [Candidatus Paraluminiphilus aquimaris]|jgi:6-phosphofructokinase 1|uniref:Pyrophosphate--fructose 6-phosphate 1-phosphotransferase n=1 Tax=Candidatus Paraluminiphilus aquimaris TaxID=2518994 RepID=A0ABY6Q2F2_9GAMM|nr:6-phosphofructokinase [Candidatus Paraluminiphilus aquimaris]UZP73249.1 6-phosphofructokinase [Candidatus Paraluminiphilus aquimaris]
MPADPAPNAFYAQSGGVTAVINASAAGVINTAALFPEKIGQVYAGQNGILGALREELIDISRESEASIQGLMTTPSGAFGSCRYKLKGIDENRAEYERLIEVFKAHNIRYFFYNGGGDSADTCQKVSEIGERLGFPLQAIHVPKTIDNDLPFTDNCPGFGSVAKYVALSTREAAFDIASMCATSTKVFILEVMGRHAGWIAGAAGLASRSEAEAPHIILFPEIAFEEERFLAKVKETVEKFGFCVIVASEGTQTADGQLLSGSTSRDAFGHVQLGGLAPKLANIIKQAHGYKYHWAVADYLQRAARHIASQTDLEQAYSLGEAAVNLAMAGKNALMPTIVRVSDEPYEWKVGTAPLDEVANQEKMMPRSFFSDDGYGITEEARRYFQPLIMGEAYPNYQDGLPHYVTLDRHLAPKKLPPDNRW